MAFDPRTKKLADLVVDYCLKVKHGENVIIAGSTEASEFLADLYKAVLLRRAHPILQVSLPELSPFFFKYAQDHQLKHFPQHFNYLVKNAHKYVGVNTISNTRQLADIDPIKIASREKVLEPITNYLVNERRKIKRVSVGFPCMAVAQEAEMSLTDYEKFVFRACLRDWRKLGRELDRILKRFRQGKEVYLTGKNVDLKFQIHGKKAQVEKGEGNMPGGEIFMAPVKESLSGWIKFEYPAIKSGKEVTGIYLEFNQGKVVKYQASKNKGLLKAMLTVDKNASYVGEFGIGCNPQIKRFTKNLLFDEKISGSIYLALGMAYKENGGGNDSAIHWDLVKDMRKAKIILDGQTVLEKGRWQL